MGILLFGFSENLCKIKIRQIEVEFDKIFRLLF